MFESFLWAKFFFWSGLIEILVGVISVGYALLYAIMWSPRG